MIVPVTFYEVRCDGPDCTKTTGDISGFEYAAWADADQAKTDWEGSDGVVLDDGRAFCWEHSIGKCCGDCDHKGDDVTDVDGDGTWLCPACAKPVS